MKNLLTLIFALLLSCAATGAALAQTPDGQPPSQETVCDNETGAAFGLCNAYCEAMDCDSANPQASATACTKVRTKFQNITGRDVPCEVTCPCQSIPEFAAGLTNANSCGIDDPTFGTFLGVPGIGPGSIIFSNAAGTPPRCGFFFNNGTSASLSITSAEAAACDQALFSAAASLGLTCH